MRVAALALLLAVAGCARDNSPRGVCERESWNDPIVKLLMEKIAGNPTQQDIWEPELDRARKRATVRCLQAAGVLPAGGVEPVIPPK
jgi:hypothetical protein